VQVAAPVVVELDRLPNSPLDFDGLIGGLTICRSPAEVVDRIGGINERLGLDNRLLEVGRRRIPFAQPAA
jgi:hypothetical protein